MIPRTQTIEVELSTKCTLSCSECPRVKYKSDIRQWNTGFLKTKPFLDNIDNHINDIIFSGAFGDPIYHPDFADILYTLVNKPHNPKITIHTNGGYISEEKYHKIGKAISSNPNNRVTVNMSVDGSLDNFTQYRVNGDRIGTEAGLKILPQYGVKVTWKVISFEYNTNWNTFKKIYDTALLYGIENIMLVHSTRASRDSYVSVDSFVKVLNRLYYYSKVKLKNTKPFIKLGLAPGYRKSFPESALIRSHPLWDGPNVITVNENSNTDNFIAKPVDEKVRLTEIINPNTTKRFINNINSENLPQWKGKVLPQCIYKKHPNFIGADGIYLPCCWLRGTPYKVTEHIKNLIGGSFDELSIYNNTIDEIIESKTWTKLSNNFSNIETCNKNCPSKANMPTKVSI